MQSTLPRCDVEETSVRAVRAMESREWPEALAHWSSAQASGELSIECIHAFARTCEVLQEWELHEELLKYAVLRYPHNYSLSLRVEFSEAMSSFRMGDWLEAFERLSRLARLESMKVWPIALGWYRWHALINIKIMGVDSLSERLAIIDDWSTFRGHGIRSSQIAGLELAIDCMGLEADLETKFRRAYLPISTFLKSTNSLLWREDMSSIKQDVGGLADFFRMYPGVLQGLPASMLGFFASFFLCFGVSDIYVRSRKLFSEKLALSIDDQALDGRLIQQVKNICFINETLDGKRFSKAESFVKRHFLGDARDHLLYFLKFSELYHRRPGAIDFRSLGEKEEDRFFSRYLKGKSVALVGPVDVGLANGAEIESFDVVIRFNCRHSDAFHEDAFGRRTDIGYYVCDDLLVGESENFLRAMNTLDFVVVDQVSLKKIEWLDQVSRPVRASMDVGGYGVNPYLLGYANAIQRVLMDIARYPVAKVKVFNANLYVSKGYSAGYAQGRVMEYFKAFSLHDPVSSFVFTKRMFELGWIEADPVLADVLDLTTDAYLERLFSVH